MFNLSLTVSREILVMEIRGKAEKQVASPLDFLRLPVARYPHLPTVAERWRLEDPA